MTGNETASDTVRKYIRFWRKHHRIIVAPRNRPTLNRHLTQTCVVCERSLHINHSLCRGVCRECDDFILDVIRSERINELICDADKNCPTYECEACKCAK